MGNASDFIQIASTVPQWGFWATVAVLSTLLLLKIISGYVKEYFSEFRSNQRYNKESLQILRDGAKILGTDPPEYVGVYDIFEQLRRNRGLWESFPDEVAKRCTSMGCPMHKAIQEDMRAFHTGAQKVLDKFAADSEISRAATLELVKGIAHDVELLHQTTLPTIQHIVEIMSKRESADKKDRD